MANEQGPIESLEVLLQTLSPRLMPGKYAYACLSSEQAAQGAHTDGALATFRETEGTTLIVEQSIAEHAGWLVTFPCAWIQLDVQSALNAVGLTAAVSQALTQEGISCNVVAAYHHDHLFVPEDQAQRALQVLQALQRKACST